MASHRQLCNPDIPILLQFIAQPSLKTPTHQKPDRNLGVEKANASNTNPCVSRIKRGCGNVDALDGGHGPTGCAVRKNEVLTCPRAEKHILLGTGLKAGTFFKSVQSIVDLCRATTKTAHGLSSHEFSFSETSVEPNTQEFFDSVEGFSIHQFFV